MVFLLVMSYNIIISWCFQTYPVKAHQCGILFV